jgi:hypothetical protein
VVAGARLGDLRWGGRRTHNRREGGLAAEERTLISRFPLPSELFWVFILHFGSPCWDSLKRGGAGQVMQKWAQSHAHYRRSANLHVTIL